MTTEEAITLLEQMILGREAPSDRTAEAINLAIAALKKQIRLKPIRIHAGPSFDGNWDDICPTCKAVLVTRITTEDYSRPIIYNGSNRCLCGQALDRG